MAGNILLQLTPEQAAAAAEIFAECGDLREFGCRVIESMMNSMMDAEAQSACGAGRNERSEARENSRNGYRERSLKTALGDVSLKVPKLRHGTYSPEGFLGRYTRVEASLVALVSEMYVAGVSTRKVDAVARELGVSSLSSSEVSSLCSELDAEVERFRARDLGGGPHAYVWLDATYMRCRVGGRYVSRALVTAIGLDQEGRKEFLGAECLDAESYEGWRGFLSGLRERGLEGVRLVVSDDHAGLVRAVREVFCGCAWQRCVTHLQRNVQGHVRSAAGRAAAADLVRAATTQRDPLVARAVWDAAEPWVSSLSAAAGRVFSEAREDALAFMSFPEAHWAKIRTNNVQERANREIKRRYRAVQSFPSEDSMMRLVCSVLMGEEGRWAAQRVFSPESAALALAPAPDPGEPTAERLAAARLRAAEVVREVVDRRGLEM
jgi:transposase-like protein